MGKFIIGFFACFLLLCVIVSCDMSKKTGVDGYWFKQESFTRNSFTTDIVLVPNEEELKKLFAEKGGENAENLAAFTLLSQTENKCTIYMIDPKVQYEPEFIGHELVHCIYGEWHKGQ